MTKITKFILNHKAWIIAIFAVVIALSVVGVFFVEKNSDIQEYLPEDSLSSIGKTELSEKFGIKGEFSIAIKGASRGYLDSFTASLEGNGVVKQVAWIGKFDALRDAEGDYEHYFEESYAKVLSKYVKTADDGKEVYILGVYLSTNNSDERVVNLIGELSENLEKAAKDGNIDEYFMGGGAVNSKTMLESSIGEIPKYLVIAVIAIAIILAITTKSWLEPLVFLLTLGISIIINMGSNIILGTISTITYSASTILQLALAMDYSIFLMHSFYEERKNAPLADAKTAMSRALPKTLKSVSASALTTIGGFIALFAMEFGIGIDLGAVLAKGVLLSLITVVVLQPVLILLLDKPISKTQHRFFNPKLKRVPKFATKHYRPIILVALLLVVPAFLGQLAVPLSYLTVERENPNPTQAEIVVQKANNQVIILLPDNSEKDSKDFEKHYKLINRLQNKTEFPEIENVFSAYTLVPRIVYVLGIELPPELQAQLTGNFFQGGYVLYTIELNTPIESQETFNAINRMSFNAQSIFGEGVKVGMTGLAVAANDLNDITPTDFMKVSLISAGIIFLILLLTYRSFVNSLILLFVIELGIWINLSLVTLTGIHINFMSYLIISSIQLGATVDYAILAASKHRQELANGERDEIKAIYTGISKASPSIMVSASILIIACISVFSVTSNVIMQEITVLIAAGALMSTILVMTLLPAILTFKTKMHERLDEKRLAKAGIPAKALTPPDYVDLKEDKVQESESEE